MYDLESAYDLDALPMHLVTSNSVHNTLGGENAILVASLQSPVFGFQRCKARVVRPTCTGVFPRR